MKEALLYKKGEVIKCLNCPHFCLIEKNKRGLCGVRENISGKLYALNYGQIVSLSIDPVEKKPLFHFLPQSLSLSLSAMGCNLKCQNCQNWEISQKPKPDKEILGNYISPQDIVSIAKKEKIPSISYTYTEPTVFLEYALDVMKLAKQEGIKNIWVSNGFISHEAIELVSPFLDAINIDIKSFSNDFYLKNCQARLSPVLESAKEFKKRGAWVEITTLAIPGLSDTEEDFKGISSFIKNNLGAETPWHISRFSGSSSWQLKHLPDTDYDVLQDAYNIGKKAGLKYVYTGNVFGVNSENTYCPDCNTLLIERNGYLVKRFDKKGRCSCGKNIDLI